MIEDISRAGAALIEVFQYPGNSLDPPAATLTEHHWPFRVARPGMLRKLISIRKDTAGCSLSGASCSTPTKMLCCTRIGMPTRTETIVSFCFGNSLKAFKSDGRGWRVAGANDFSEVTTTQPVKRVERWHSPSKVNTGEVCEHDWPRIRQAVYELGRTSVRLRGETSSTHSLGLTRRAMRIPARQAALLTIPPRFTVSKPAPQLAATCLLKPRRPQSLTAPRGCTPSDTLSATAVPQTTQSSGRRRRPCSRWQQSQLPGCRAGNNQPDNGSDSPEFHRSLYQRHATQDGRSRRKRSLDTDERQDISRHHAFATSVARPRQTLTVGHRNHVFIRLCCSATPTI